MLEFLLWGLWLVLGGYTFSFVSKARTIQPQSLDGFASTWKLHKRESGCDAPLINELLMEKQRSGPVQVRVRSRVPSETFDNPEDLQVCQFLAAEGSEHRVFV